MPIPFAPLFGFALGGILAWVAGAELVRDDGPIVASRPFQVVTAFAALVWLPAIGYFVAFHGDWSYVYLAPWQRVPSAIDLGLVLVASAAVVGGFWFAVSPVRKRRTGPIVAIVVAPGLLGTVGLVAASRRLALSGTFAQYHGDFGTVPIGSSPLGKGVLFMGVVLAVGIAWTVRSLLRMSTPE